MWSRYISRKKQSGQATMMMAFAIVPMIGLMGMATDLGYMHYVKQSAQAAADAAAMAGIVQFHNLVSGSNFTCGQTNVTCASSYQCPTGMTSASTAIDTACIYAQQNGFQATGSQNVLIDSNTGSTPPFNTTGLSSESYWITVRVSQKVPQLFSAITGNFTGLVSARATAATVPAKDCLYTLDPSSSGALYINGNGSVTLSCGVFDNSSSSTAMYNSGAANSLSATEYDIVGGYQWQGNGLSGTPNTGVPHTGDPLAYLNPPSPCDSAGGCAAADCSAHPTLTTISSDTEISPGTYCGGIYVSHGLLTMDPGTYILVGGGIGTQDSGSKISGTGVTIYNTYNSANPYTGIGFSANSKVSLSAPTTGTYAGILFFGDRSITTSPTLYTEQIWAGSTAKFEGTIYFPKSMIEFGGNPTMTTSNYTIIVGWQVQVQGNSTLNANYSMLPGGSPSNNSVAMVE